MPLRGLTLHPLAGAADRGGDRARGARGRRRVGFRKFRLTGGEPTLRPDLVEIVRPHRRAARRRRRGHDHQRHPAAAAGPRRWPRPACAGSTSTWTPSTPSASSSIMRFGTLRGDRGRASRPPRRRGCAPIKINCVVTRDYNDMDVVDMARRALRARLARALHRADAAGRRRDRARGALAVRAHPRDAGAHRGGAGPAACPLPNAQPVGRVAQLPLRGRARAWSASSAR